MSDGAPKVAVDEEAIAETKLHITMPEPGNAPPQSREYYCLLQFLAVLTTLVAIGYLIASCFSFKLNSMLFFPITTTVWSALQVLSMIAVLIASFARWNGVLVSVAAVCIPCLCGDVVILVFCAVWYPRPIARPAAAVLAMNSIFIVVQLAWVILACSLAKNNEVRAGNQASDHTHTTKAFNDDPMENNAEP